MQYRKGISVVALVASVTIIAALLTTVTISRNKYSK